MLTMCVCVSAMLAAMSGCKQKAEETPEVQVTVEAAHPTEGPISEEIAADAVLAPLAQAALTPRISAPIRAEYVQRGARVHRGQLLVSLEAGDLRASAEDNRGALTTAKANYTTVVGATIPEDLTRARGDAEQAKAARDVARRAADERKKLFQQGALSGREADTALAAAVQADAAYALAEKHLQAVESTTGRTVQQAAQGQLTSAQGRLAAAEAQVSYAELRSPINGVVTDRPLFPGETASAGSPVVTVMDTTSLLAKLHVAQATAQQLSVGRPAQVTVSGVNDPVEARVSFISPALDPGSTTVEVWLKLPNQNGRFRAGTPVHVAITGNTVAKALLVPAAAILPAQDGGTAVLVVGPDGAAHRKAVTVGIRTTDDAQVLSGISTSDLVVTSGGYGLDDGAKVTVGKPGAAAEDGAVAKDSAAAKHSAAAKDSPAATKDKN